MELGMAEIYQGDCLHVLQALHASRLDLPSPGFARLVYMDPPFNTGKVQQRTRIKVRRTTPGELGTRTGFGGARYETEHVEPVGSYADAYGEEYLDFLMPRIKAAVACLVADGSLLVHLDPRESHYVKVALDKLLGRDKFMNEIVWAYDYGGRPKDRWPKKHDVILWYALKPGHHVFNFDAIDRIPYLAPSLVGDVKAARGKTPTDVHWHTIVPTNGKEKTGYPTQKPLGLLRRLVQVHSGKGDVVLDPFAGSGTTGAAAKESGRGFVGIDQNPEAVKIMRKRLG
jgi:site-specific DNA-methyltransferase (adenine-specific)